jgi:glutamate carboxypeptidase
MKAGLLVACFAMEALQQLNLTPKKNVVFLLNSDEEIGSLSSRDLIEAEARKSDFCLVVEPARQGALTTWRKGVGRFVMKVRGLTSHAGVDPEKGASAIEELARQIVTLHSFTNLEIGTTVNVGVISGGTRPNVIAAEAEAEIDLRVMTLAEGERMVAAILGLQAQDPRTTVTIEGGMNRPPFEETPDSQVLAQKAQSIATKLGFSTGTIGSGGGSDGNFASALGVPTLDGLGGVGAGSHALTEHTEIDFLPKRAALLAELILSL